MNKEKTGARAMTFMANSFTDGIKGLNRNFGRFTMIDQGNYPMRH